MKLAQAILREELVVFEERFKEAVKSQTPLLDRIMRFIVNRKGKQLRPMFVLLSAKLCGHVNEQSYRAASLVELLHTATLVHDDVVDESLERRGFFSTYALWKSKVSILVGDYLLSKGLLLSLDHDDFRILQLLSDAVRRISEGELLQLEKSRSLNLDENVYFEIIRNKTASLLASSCAAGAFASSQDEALTDKLRRFGENVGIAFQIKDDLFDYGSEDVGKPTGNDIREKKLTLPLIYTLNTIDKTTRREIIYIIKNQNKDRAKVQWVIQKVAAAGGMEYANRKMNTYRDQALAILYEFQDSDVRRSLEELVRYTTDRRY
ncbi:MAG: polyprenyl synthetase family protein [Bacteroidota bacterium]|nr:polyprenyl synthetase family protein [Bacteroidota bacterium]MDP4218446.1 polyprenyl synthetase family protein [Bacteroidota bacterium]MDP4247275.1 polyprenyl synthetase family protein [Bacteroidota bacterium]MDP4256314.1 polyprenyl synthetase family protein [Bacteroidota bacterium]MDP4256804.1 polyprenyl synthetase family protein [Bacteroidota bacterium]